MGKKSSNAIAASIYARKNDGSLYKVLGQFELEKNTGCGDLLQVGDREFEVVTARSQFKYAGGKIRHGEKGPGSQRNQSNKAGSNVDAPDEKGVRISSRQKLRVKMKLAMYRR